MAGSPEDGHIEIRSVEESDLPDFRRLHNRFVDRDESLETVREWYEERPDLLIGAYHGNGLVGHCLGRPWAEDVVELAGISVRPEYRRRGIGSELLTAFEERAASLGFERVTLGSGGGYVDEFYGRNGYEAESVLVRLHPEDVPKGYHEMGYEIIEETADGETRKVYVEADGIDPSFLDRVREDFGDPEAIYVLEKDLDP